MAEKSNSGLHTSAKNLEKAKDLLFFALTIDIIFNLISIFNSYATITALQNFQEFDQQIIDSINSSETFIRITIISMIGVGLTLLKWLNSSYEYAKAEIDATDFKYENWVALAWIVPIYNFFRPYQIINEIYKAGSPSHHGKDTWGKEDASGILITWWVFYVLTHLIITFIVKIWMGISISDPSPGLFIDEFQIYIAICLLSILISGLWYLVIIELTKRLLNRTKKSQTDNIVNNQNVKSVTSRSIDSETPYTALDNNHFLLALEEYESDKRDKGLWAKCFALSNGEESITKSMYLKERADNFAKNDVGVIEKRVAQMKDADKKDEIANSEKNIKEPLNYEENYSNHSAKFMIENNFYLIKEYKNIKYWLLKNNDVAIKLNEYIYVYFNERDCKKSIDSCKLHDRTKVVLNASSINK